MHIRFLLPIKNENILNLNDLKKYQTEQLKLDIDYVDLSLMRIEDQKTIDFIVPKLIDLAIKAEKEKIDVIVIFAAMEMGIEEISKKVKIPVLSPFAALIKMLKKIQGQAIIVDTHEMTRANHIEVTHQYGLTAKIADFKLLAVKNNEKGLVANENSLLHELEEICLSMRKINANTLVLGSIRLREFVEPLQKFIAQQGLKINILEPLDACVLENMKPDDYFIFP